MKVILPFWSLSVPDEGYFTILEFDDEGYFTLLEFEHT